MNRSILWPLVLVTVAAITACSRAEPAATTIAPTTTRAQVSPSTTTTTVTATTSTTITAGADAGDVPLPRGYHVMLGISESFGVLMAGGETGAPVVPGGGVTLSCAWGYRPPQGWVNLTRDGVDIFGVAAAYDAQSNRVIVVGEDTTWSYDPDTNTWASDQGDGRPTNTLGALAAYDAGSNRVILLDLNATTWAYDFDTMTWMEMQATFPPGPGRDFYMMAYDEESDRVILFGGWRNRNDTWAYDYDTDTWTEMTPDLGPPGRQYGTMVYHPGTDRMILFGGVTEPGNSALGDTWAYDYDSNTWTELSPPISPQPRGRHGMAYNPIDGTIVLFGGGSGPAWEERPTETWIFDPAENTWTDVG